MPVVEDTDKLAMPAPQQPGLQSANTAMLREMGEDFGGMNMYTDENLLLMN